MHLPTGKHPLAKLFCYGDLLQNSSALSGRTLRASGRITSEPRLELLVSPSTATGNLLYRVNDKKMKDRMPWGLPVRASGWKHFGVLVVAMVTMIFFFGFEKKSTLILILLTKHGCIWETIM